MKNKRNKENIHKNQNEKKYLLLVLLNCEIALANSIVKGLGYKAPGNLRVE